MEKIRSGASKMARPFPKRFSRMALPFAPWLPDSSFASEVAVSAVTPQPPNTCKQFTGGNKRGHSPRYHPYTRIYTSPTALWPRRPAAQGRHSARLRLPPSARPHRRTLIERFADGAPALKYASPVASLSVLREIAIFNQHGFVNLFTDKRINTPHPDRRGTSLCTRLPAPRTVGARVYAKGPKLRLPTTGRRSLTIEVLMTRRLATGIPPVRV